MYITKKNLFLSTIIGLIFAVMSLQASQSEVTSLASLVEVAPEVASSLPVNQVEETSLIQPVGNNDINKPVFNRLTLADKIEIARSDDFDPLSQVVLQTSALATIIGISVISSYVATTYLIQEKHLVKAKYPDAQAWYNAMNEKYPAAHLDSKLFLQTMRGVPAKLMSWCSTTNQIYFPQEALHDINFLYRKQVNNIEPLTDEENLFLGMQEFILLHEAGHIEHNHITKRILTVVGLFASVLTLRAVYKIYNDEANLINMLSDENPDYISQDDIDGVQLVYDFCTWFIAFMAFDIMVPFVASRPQEFEADKFAYENADDLALQGGIAFFENEERDPLFDIKNQQFSPFIKTESTVGTMVQGVVGYFEIPAFYNDKEWKQFIASTSFTRWLYDYNRGSSHPGPSVRANIIKEEVARRENDKQA